jgi:hypothetical protein
MLSIVAAGGCETKTHLDRSETSYGWGPAWASAATAPIEAPATQPVDVKPATQPIDAGPAAHLPYTVTRFAREGPVTGVVIKLDLSDPRVHVRLSLADDRDPDGPGPAVGRLDTIVSAATKQDLEIATNASYFSVVGQRVAQGKKVGYFVGNGTFPSGYLMIDGKLLGTPKKDFLRAVLVIHKDGKLSIEGAVTELPADTKDAVSGSAKILTRGELTPPEKDEARHPRTAVGLSEDGKTMVIMAIDGRRPTVSRGTTLAETATFLKEFGASEGINLDGGGSTTMVVKDAVTGVHAIVNKPSETFSLQPQVDSVQRPVLDVLGVQIDDE